MDTIQLEIPRWRTKWRPLNTIIGLAIINIETWFYSILHFAVCQLLRWHFLLKKVLKLKKDCNLHQQVRFQASVFFFLATHLNQLYLFGHIARASPEDDCQTALPQSRSCMKFANDDDDYIYDNEHGLK